MEWMITLQVWWWKREARERSQGRRVKWWISIAKLDSLMLCNFSSNFFSMLYFLYIQLMIVLHHTVMIKVNGQTVICMFRVSVPLALFINTPPIKFKRCFFFLTQHLGPFEFATEIHWLIIIPQRRAIKNFHFNMTQILIIWSCFVLGDPKRGGVFWIKIVRLSVKLLCNPFANKHPIDQPDSVSKYDQKGVTSGHKRIGLKVHAKWWSFLFFLSPFLAHLMLAIFTGKSRRGGMEIVLCIERALLHNYPLQFSLKHLIYY